MLKFPKGFFDAEERDGFYIESEMKHVWAAQLEMIKILENICSSNDIKYFAMYGTLIGAIRHQGFIPWDDDVDIAMIREDYNRLMQISPDQLPNHFWILNPFSESEWDEVLGRIVNGNSISVSGERLLGFHGCPYAIGSDIFPIDYIPNDNDQKQWKDSLIDLICKLLPYAWNSPDNKEAYESDIGIQNTLDEGISVLEETFNFKFYKEGNLRNQLCCLFDTICSAYGDNMDRYMTKYPGYILYGENYYYHKSWFETTIPMKFEYTSIMVPIGYDAVTYIRYGHDYMIPQNIKANHDYPFYKGQRELLKEKKMYEFVEQMREISKAASCSDNIVIDQSLEKQSIPIEWKERIYIGDKKKKVRIYGLNSAALIIAKTKVIEKLEEEVNRYISVCKEEVLILVEDLVFESTLKDIYPEYVKRFEKAKKTIIDNNGIISQNTNYKYYEICDEYVGDCTSAAFGFVDRNIPTYFEEYKE